MTIALHEIRLSNTGLVYTFWDTTNGKNNPTLQHAKFNDDEQFIVIHKEKTSTTLSEDHQKAMQTQAQKYNQEFLKTLSCQALKRLSDSENVKKEEYANQNTLKAGSLVDADYTYAIDYNLDNKIDELVIHNQSVRIYIVFDNNNSFTKNLDDCGAQVFANLQ